MPKLTYRAAAFLLTALLMLWAAAAHGASPVSEPGTPPRRVISMAPNITETVYALGAGNSLVGVSDFCVYPEEARGLPRVGGYVNPNLERIIALAPDLVLVQGNESPVERFLQEKNIPHLRVSMDSMATILSGIEILGKALHREVSAVELEASIRQGLAQVAKQAALEKKIRVYISLYRPPGSLANLMTAGSKSFMHELVSLAGGENIFADLPGPYPVVSKESLLVRDPEVILEFAPDRDLGPNASEILGREWEPLDATRAVSRERIEILSQDYLLIPGPRVVQAALAVGRAMGSLK